MDSMYVTLPSNSNMSVYPSNQPAEFKVKLAKKLQMASVDGWEVGLVDMHYSNSVQNLDTGEMYVTEQLPLEDGGSRNHTFAMRPGRYATIEEVIVEMNRQMNEFHSTGALSMSYDGAENRSYINFRVDNLFIAFSADLARILGFRQNPMSYCKPYGVEADKIASYGSPLTPDYSNGLNQLYVYASCADERPVGDTLARLLRVVPVLDKRLHKNVYVEFMNIHYVPVGNLNDNVIEVNITRDDGELVPFIGGRVVLTVHFRKRPR